MTAEIPDIGIGSLAGRRLLAGLPMRVFLIFFVAVPLAVGLNQGWLQAGLARYLPQTQSIILWCGNWLLYWWACELLTRIAAAVLRPWRLAPLVIVALGGVVATLLSPLYFSAYSLLFMDYMPPGLRVSEARDMARLLEPAFLLRLLASGSGGMLLWVLANLFVQGYLGWPRFQALGLYHGVDGAVAPLATDRDRAISSPAAQPPQSAVTPALFARLARLELPRAATLIAIEAQEHYVKVHTDQGAELVYYRFGDAIRDLQGWDGLQVHRSWWIARAAALRVEHEDRRMRVVLRNALVVPVGSSFVALVRQAGFPGSL